MPSVVRPWISERATLYSSTEFKKIRLLYFTGAVLFAINKETGEIDPNTADNEPGMEALDHADQRVLLPRLPLLAVDVVEVTELSDVLRQRDRVHRLPLERIGHQFHLLVAGAGPEKDEPFVAQSKINRAQQDAPLANLALVGDAARNFVVIMKDGRIFKNVLQ